MTGINPDLDLIHFKVFTKFSQILFICSEDMERKQISDIKQKLSGNNPNVDHVL